MTTVGTAVAQCLRCCATNRTVAGSIPAGVSGIFIDIKSFRSHCGPGVDSTTNRNGYQEYFLGVKAAGAYYHPVPLLRNMGTWTSWNPLGPSGPVTWLLYLLPWAIFRMRNVSGKFVEKIKTHILCSIHFFFENNAVDEIKWKYIVEWGRPQMTVWRTGIACWIPKATNTH